MECSWGSRGRGLDAASSWGPGLSWDTVAAGLQEAGLLVSQEQEKRHWEGHFCRDHRVGTRPERFGGGGVQEHVGVGGGAGSVSEGLRVPPLLRADAFPTRSAHCRAPGPGSAFPTPPLSPTLHSAERFGHAMRHLPSAPPLSQDMETLSTHVTHMLPTHMDVGTHTHSGLEGHQNSKTPHWRVTLLR